MCPCLSIATRWFSKYGRQGNLALRNVFKPSTVVKSDVFWTAEAKNHFEELVDGRGAAMFRRTAVHIRS
jgi:hypothetical protein